MQIILANSDDAIPRELKRGGLNVGSHTKRRLKGLNSNLDEELKEKVGEIVSDLYEYVIEDNQELDDDTISDLLFDAISRVYRGKNYHD
jgi:hypothetical protein